MTALARSCAAPAALSYAAAPDQLTAWLTAAAAGDQAIYASGLELPREEAGVKLVSQWIAAGAVHPFQQRDPRDAGRWNFLIVKAGREEFRGGRVSARERGGVTAVTAQRMRRMLRRLTRLAEDGAPCPSYRQLAAELHLRDAQAARYVLGRLAEDGTITVDDCGPLRVVTIVRTGKQTASGEGK